MSNRAIAERLGVGESTVRRAVDDNGRQGALFGAPGPKSPEKNGGSRAKNPRREVQGRDGKFYPVTKLIPEFESRRNDLSPKAIALLETWPKTLQKDALRLEAQYGLGKAMNMVADQRQPGDEEPEEKNGAVIFDRRKFDEAFGKIRRAVDDLARIKGDPSGERRRCLNHLENFLTEFNRWAKLPTAKVG